VVSDRNVSRPRGLPELLSRKQFAPGWQRRCATAVMALLPIGRIDHEVRAGGMRASTILEHLQRIFDVQLTMAFSIDHLSTTNGRIKMRDLNLSELSHVYGAGGSSKKCYDPCAGRKSKSKKSKSKKSKCKTTKVKKSKGCR
jgi:hypothetical protein